MLESKGAVAGLIDDMVSQSDGKACVGEGVCLARWEGLLQLQSVPFAEKPPIGFEKNANRVICRQWHTTPIAYDQLINRNQTVRFPGSSTPGQRRT